MALFKVTRHAYKPDNPAWGIRKESWYIEAPSFPAVYLYVANDEMTSKAHDLRFKEIDPMLVGPGGHEADVTIDANGQAVDKQRRYHDGCRNGYMCLWSCDTHKA